MNWSQDRKGHLNELVDAMYPTKLLKEFTKEYKGYFVGTYDLGKYFNLNDVGANYKFINNNIYNGLEELWLTEEDYIGDPNYSELQLNAKYYLVYEHSNSNLKKKLLFNWLIIKEEFITKNSIISNLLATYICIKVVLNALL